MAGLGEGVVVEVAELGVGGVTTRAVEPGHRLWHPRQTCLLRHGHQLAIPGTAATITDTASGLGRGH
jgi:hypothetical protein